jgi:hypothetical protein
MFNHRTPHDCFNVMLGLVAISVGKHLALQAHKIICTDTVSAQNPTVLM